VRLGFDDEDWYRIVGVADNVHFADLQSAPEEMVYWPATIGPAAAPQATRGMDVVIRTSFPDPTTFIPTLRREVRNLNPRIPVANPRALSDVLRAATARVSFTLALLAAASGIALLLGIVGIYGVITYIVAQRTREIGVRMALGATAGRVRGMVVRQGLGLAAVGVAIGLFAAVALSSLIGSLLFGVSATDPFTYAAVAGALLTVATAASWLPARRAAAVPPSTALRAE
jgi:predicted lysophospholipase L1 biosynthesis ABC-type transport system permease subunit